MKVVSGEVCGTWHGGVSVNRMNGVVRKVGEWCEGVV